MAENGTEAQLEDTFAQESFDAGDTSAATGLTEDSGVEDPVSFHFERMYRGV